MREGGLTSRFWVLCRIRVRCPSANRAHTGASFVHKALIYPPPHCAPPDGRQRPRCSGLPEPCPPPRPCAAAIFRAGPLMLLSLLGKTDILGEDRHPAPTLSRGLSVCQTTLRYNLQAELGLWPALQAAQGRELASDPLNLPEASGKTWSCACSRSPLSQEGLQQPRLRTTPREMPQGQGPNKPTD